MRLGLSLIGYAFLIVLIFRAIPESIIDNTHYLNSLISYIVIGTIFMVLSLFKGLHTLDYFRWPRISWKSVIAILIAATFIHQTYVSHDFEIPRLSVAILGVLYLLSVGYGEEMFSRVFNFGVLEKYGRRKAIFYSSLLFAALHLNLYIGRDWDPWLAYWHLMSTFSFGVFFCALLIVTRSIWLVVIFHALMDISVVFEKASDYVDDGKKVSTDFWTGFSYPFLDVAIRVLLAMFLLRIDRGGWPRWMVRVAIRFKLVHAEVRIDAGI